MFKKVLKSNFIMGWSHMALILLLALGGTAFAQNRYTPAELDTLVATIALYPDPLLVHVLNATTHGDDIPSASAFAKAHRNLKGDDLAKSIENADLGYDESVIALIAFPDVLEKLAKYATWTNQLGEAFDMQKADVMDAVQRMRKTAHKNGYLQSDDKVSVTVGENVVIQPVREEYIYVPEYDPRVVYYVTSTGNIRLRYANGAWIGAGLVYWGWDPFDYDWVHRRPLYRHPRRYAPPPRHHARPKQRPVGRFDNPPPPPPPSHSKSAWDRRPATPPPAPPRSNATWERHSASPVPSPVPSNTLRKSAPSAPPPPPNYKRPVPPPPPPSSSNDGESRESRRVERLQGSHNPPAPPPSRRSDHGRR